MDELDSLRNAPNNIEDASWFIINVFQCYDILGKSRIDRPYEPIKPDTRMIVWNVCDVDQ
jgi:hypothetical protein